MDFLSGLAGAACGIAQGLYNVYRSKPSATSTALVRIRSPARDFKLPAPPRLQACAADVPGIAYGVPTYSPTSAVVCEFKVERLPVHPRIG